MPTLTVYDMKKKKVGEAELSDSVFGVEVNGALLHEAVCAHLSNCRQGNACTKTRREVRGGGKKPYRQKGTGQARHGSSRSPIFVGGGITFGPRPRNWRIEMPKQQRKAALKSALSMKAKDETLFLVDKWESTSGKTCDMAKVLKVWEAKSALIVSDKADEKTIRSLRNIPNVKLLRDAQVNVYDLVRYEKVLLTEKSAKNISERFV